MKFIDFHLFQNRSVTPVIRRFKKCKTGNKDFFTPGNLKRTLRPINPL
jgi:hypothetical protein